MNNDDLKRVAFMLELMSKRIDAIDQRVNEMSKRIDDIISPSVDDDDESWEGFGPKPEQRPVNPNAEAYTLELHHGPFTIYRDDGEPDGEWQRRKDHLMSQRITFLNGSGKTGTPEQAAYLEEIMERMQKARSPKNNSEKPLATT